jgi:membrane dipeptidase
MKTQNARTAEVHAKTLIVDGLSGVDQPAEFNEEYVRRLKEGGVTATHITIPGVERFDAAYAMRELAEWFYQLRKLKASGMKLATAVKEVRAAKKEGTIVAILGSQSAAFLGDELHTMDLLKELGMRTMQPTYQRRNQFGGGCAETSDTGLSLLGVEWVEKMNEIGMLISLSHVGYKTSMEVMEISKDPVVFDHSNPRALCDHVRNIRDDQIEKCAEGGGVIGACPEAMFLRTDKGPDELSVSDFIDHIDYLVKLTGVDHVGIGLDLGEEHYVTPEQILEHRRRFPGLTSEKIGKVEDEFIKSGRDRLYHYELQMPWFKSVSNMPIITDALLSRGYSDQDIAKIMGENFLNVFERVWGE